MSYMKKEQEELVRRREQLGKAIEEAKELLKDLELQAKGVDIRLEKIRSMAEAVKKDDGYRPNYAVLPGVTIWETMWERDIGSGDLANRLGLPEYYLMSILKGCLKLDMDIAKKVESILELPQGIIMRLDKIYRETKERIENDQRRD